MIDSGLATRLNFERALNEAHDAYRAGNFYGALELCQLIYPAHATNTGLLLLVGAIHYQLGNYEQCIQFNDRCIVLDPHLAEAYANLANALQQLGNFDMAIVYYQSALRLKPDFTDAYNNLASALVHKGFVPAAFHCFDAALQLDPNCVDAYINSGDIWKAQGKHGVVEAEKCFSEALRVDPQSAAGWRGLGDVYRERCDHRQAILCYQESIKFRMDYADAYNGMALSLKELNRKAEAILCLQQVTRLKPHCALSIGNLAGTYYEQGMLAEAIQTYRQAIACEPNFPEAYNNLANALRESSQFEEALRCYVMCIQIQLRNPNRALQQTAQHAQRLSVAYNNLGGLLKLQGRGQEAIACYEHVTLLQPDSPEAHTNLGSAYKDAAHPDIAINSYRKALQLRPNFPEAFANLVHSLQCICEWENRDGLFQRLEHEVRSELNTGKLPPVQPFHVMAYPFPADLALTISRRYADYCLNAAKQLNIPPLSHPPATKLAAGERLRVGYVSSDFGNHPLSHLMGSVFGGHDRVKIEVFCYALSQSDGSEWRLRIENEAEHFTDVSHWTVADIARKISMDKIHICVNLNGYTKGARNEIFALKPAPVQASYMGFPATTGAEYIPYLITDKAVAPENCRHCYSEHLALMPNSYFVNDYKFAHLDVLNENNLLTREAVGLPTDKIIYSCSNQLYKYDPETFQTWCNILKRVPNSVLWLLRFPAVGEENIRKVAKGYGIDESRIIFTDVAQKPIHIKRSGLADVFLDTPLCNAHTTGCDVLWGGCPIVTMPLERMASRVAASLCYATGLGEEMVVYSRAEYEHLAVELGTNHSKRQDLSRRLKSVRLTCPLFDTTRWIQDLESVFYKMWDIHCEGNGPRTFEI